MQTDQDRWVTVRHVHASLTAPEPCGGVAFTYNDPHPLGVLTASRVRYPDGSQPLPLDLVRCGTCGKQIQPDATDIREHYL